MYPTVLVISWMSHLIIRFSDMDGSDNPFGADNQQERLLARWRSSFFDMIALHSAQEESSEAIRRAPLGSEWMKRWSGPHSDMGKTVPNYNRPKVAKFLVG